MDIKMIILKKVVRKNIFNIAWKSYTLSLEWWAKWLSRSQGVWSLVSYIVEILLHSEASGAHGRALAKKVMMWTELEFRKSVFCGSCRCCLFSRVRLCATPETAAHQAPLSLGFSRQEYWSGLPLPSPGDLPDPGIRPGSPASQADSLPPEPPGYLDTD